MSFTLSTGASLSVAKSYAANLPFSAISNATDAVCTVTGSAIVAGDFVEIRSSWGLIDQKVVRVKAGSTATALILEGVDTTDTTKFPAGTGAVSAYVRKITAWSQITQIKAMSASGGTQNFANITGLADVVERQIPTTRAAVSTTVDIFDDPTLAWYADVTVASDSSTPYGLLMVFPNNSRLVANAYWGLQKVPAVGTNAALTSTISLSYVADPIRYSN